MHELNMGTAMVTPASASAYCSAMFPKKMQTPEAIANPISGAFSCSADAHRSKRLCFFNGAKLHCCNEVVELVEQCTSSKDLIACKNNFQMC